MNDSTECHRASVLKINIGSGNGLVLSGTKPLPEPVLTQIYVAIYAALGHTELWKHTKCKRILIPPCCNSLFIEAWEFSRFFMISECFRTDIIRKLEQIMRSFHILNKNSVKIVPWSSLGISLKSLLVPVYCKGLKLLVTHLLLSCHIRAWYVVLLS